MLFNDQNSELNEPSEEVLPYQKLRGLVKKILGTRVNHSFDVEDISQNVFRRGWQWASKNKKTLPEEQWRRLIAKITFNEISRFYAKKTDLLGDNFLSEETDSSLPDLTTMNPQFILEIAEQLRKLSFRQKMAIVLHDGELLPYLKIILPPEAIADLLEIDVDLLTSLEAEIPLTEARIIEVIEHVTDKECKSSIRDERSKGRKILRRRLFDL